MSLMLLMKLMRREVIIMNKMLGIMIVMKMIWMIMKFMYGQRRVLIKSQLSLMMRTRDYFKGRNLYYKVQYLLILMCCIFMFNQSCNFCFNFIIIFNNCIKEILFCVYCELCNFIEKGSDFFDMLFEGWVLVIYNSGMSVYFYK